jgi:Domain of unknown function (DUF4157)/Calpain family cysteine protease
MLNHQNVQQKKSPVAYQQKHKQTAPSQTTLITAAPNIQSLLDLQKTIGNQAVCQMLQLQTKLTLGKQNDPYEQEADQVAADVVKQIHLPDTANASNQILQDSMASKTNVALSTKKLVQCKSQTTDNDVVSDNVETAIECAKGGGQPLEENIQKSMEQAFNQDFSSVRIHTNDKADELNQAIQARAFTTGQDIFFRRGEYNPRSLEGQTLIAHELTHTVQQGGCTVQSNGLIKQKSLIPHLQRSWKKQEGEDSYKWVDDKEGDITKTPVGYSPSQANPLLALRSDNKTEEKTSKSESQQKIDPETIADTQSGSSFLDKRADNDTLMPPNRYFINKGADIYMYQEVDETWNELSSEGDESIYKKIKELLYNHAIPENKLWERDDYYAFEYGENTFAVLNNKFSKESYTYESINSVFANENAVTIDDIKQGKLGDCGLLSVIGSIVHNNPKYIREIIKDQPGDAATVRLYQIGGDSKNPTFKECFVKVSKSSPKIGAKDYGAKETPWVQILEKAIASFGCFKKVEPSLDEDFHYITDLDLSANSSYENLVQMPASYAFGILLGKPAQQMLVKSKDTAAPWSDARRSIYDFQPTKGFNDIFNDASLIEKWIDFLNKRSEKDFTMEMKFPKDSTISDQYKKIYGQELCFEHCEKFFFKMLKQKKITEEVAALILKWCEENLPGKRGTGNYSEAQKNIFEFIKINLDQKKCMTIGSKKLVGRTSEGEGMAGEIKSKGLAGKHVYTVLACRRNAGENPENQNEHGKLCWIKLRNPWGNYGRQYNWDAAKGSKAKFIDALGGEFWIELSDLTKRFVKITAEMEAKEIH